MDPHCSSASEWCFIYKSAFYEVSDGKQRLRQGSRAGEGEGRQMGEAGGRQVAGLGSKKKYIYSVSLRQKHNPKHDLIS